MHTIWAYGVPWAANICNCGPKDCIAFRAGERMTRAYFKAEYVAAMDIEKCTGCRDCMSFCNFGAIQYSPAAGKCTINQFKCAGCGLCRQACSFDAITLFDRNAIPVLANDW